MKKLLLLLSASVIFAFSGVQAATVTSSGAQTIAANFFKLTYPNQVGHTPLSLVLKYTKAEADGSVDFYVFDVNPVKGFVIVSAHDEVIPVIAYSNESYFDLDFSKTGVANWVNKTAGQIHNTVIQQISADDRINNAWTAYRQGIKPASEKSNSVGPMLTTTWNQEPYYNQYCPINPNDGQRSVTGCVATAMAQIMKYWNYPPQGSGSFSYVDDNAHGYQNNIGTLSANFGSTTYQWTQMPNHLTANNTAVGTLMSHAGISVAMDYSDGGSGAYVLQSEANQSYGYQGAPCAQHSFATYFLYNPNTLQGVSQSRYSTQQWINLLEGEMNAGRVVEYEGDDPTAGGHTWVCDGYDVNNNLHMNWGWGGVYNGFYAVTNLSAGGYTFNYYDAALIGIEPPSYTPPGNGFCVTVRGDSVNDPNSVINTIVPTTNTRGNELVAQQWTWNSVPGEGRALLSFNLSFIPANAYITSASISLYANPTASNGYTGEPTYGTNNACYLEQITSPWSPDGVTWNNQPSVTTANEVLLPQSTSNTENYLNYDITTFVKYWQQNPSLNYGMMLKMITSNYYNIMDFCTSAYPDTSKRPQLNVCYLTCNAAASFTYQSLGGSVIQFSNTSTSNQAFSSNWTFYNAQGAFTTSTATNPQITFLGQPPYSARLIINDSLISTCIDTVTQIVTFNPNTTCVTYQDGNTKCNGAQISSLASQAGTNYSFASGYNEIFSEQWTSGGLQLEGRGLLEYNLSQIPVGSVIVSAGLSLYVDSLHGNGAGTYGTDNASYLYQITSPWNPNTVTWNTQPTTTTTGEVLLPLSTNTNENYLNLNVTGFVQNWVNNPATNYGMLLQMITQNTYNSMVFCSSAYADTTKWPKLQICYIAPNSCQASASFVEQNLGAGQVRFTSTSTDSRTFTYNWTFYDASGQFTTSTVANPVITFTGQPPFSATLVIIDSVCRDSVTHVVNVSNCTTYQFANTKCTGAEISSLSSQASTNYNFTGYGECFAEQWTSGGIPFEARGLLHYDLSQIPVGAVILSAGLSLYVDTTHSNGGGTYGTDDVSHLFQVTSPWNPNTVTWNTQPATSANGAVILPQSTNVNENYLNLDVSAFVQGWVNNPGTNYGMLLQIGTPYTYNSMVFCSSSYGDSTRWPKLDICYQLPSPCHLLASFNQQNLGNGTVQFNNTSTNNGSTISHWTFYNASGVLSTSNVFSPLVTFSGNPPFSATLLLTDTLHGCLDSVVEAVNIVTCVNLQQGISAGVGSVISSYSPTQNFNYAGGYAELFAEQWTVSGVPLETQALLQYNLSQIPAGTSVISANLNLYADINNSNGRAGQPTFGNDNACYLHQVTGAWNPASVTWNNKPAVSNTNNILLAQSTNTDEDYLNINVSNLVQSWVNSPATNNGLMLEIITQNYYNSMIFCSPSYADSTLRPSLQICYFTPSPILGCNITDSFTYHVLDGDTVQFTNYSTSNQTIVSSWIFSNGNGQFATSSLPNPVIVFPAPAPYTAFLAVSDSGGSRGCIDSFARQITIATGINEPGAQQTSLVIFPNPNNGSSFNVQWPVGYDAQTTEVKLYDVLGREVNPLSIERHPGFCRLSINESASAGIYTVVISGNATQKCGKLVIVR